MPNGIGVGMVKVDKNEYVNPLHVKRFYQDSPNKTVVLYDDGTSDTFNAKADTVADCIENAMLYGENVDIKA